MEGGNGGKGRIIFCFFSPSTWTKGIAILDIVMRTGFIILEASAIANYLSYGNIYTRQTALTLLFALDPWANAKLIRQNWVAACSVSIMRHSLGLIIACLLLIGTVKRISKFLHLWCLFALVDTVITWMSSVFQMKWDFFYVKGIETAVILFFGFIVLTLVDEIDTENRKRINHLENENEDDLELGMRTGYSVESRRNRDRTDENPSTNFFCRIPSHSDRDIPFQSSTYNFYSGREGTRQTKSRNVSSSRSELYSNNQDQMGQDDSERPIAFVTIPAIYRAVPVYQNRNSDCPTHGQGQSQVQNPGSRGASSGSGRDCRNLISFGALNSHHVHVHAHRHSHGHGHSHNHSHSRGQSTRDLKSKPPPPYEAPPSYYETFSGAQNQPPSSNIENSNQDCQTIT